MIYTDTPRNCQIASGLRASGQLRWRNADYSYASEDKTGTRNDNVENQRTSITFEMAFIGEALRYRRSSADELSTTNTPEKAASGEWTYPRRTNFELSEHPVDEVRQLKVWCQLENRDIQECSQKIRWLSLDLDYRESLQRHYCQLKSRISR